MVHWIPTMFDPTIIITPTPPSPVPPLQHHLAAVVNAIKIIKMTPLRAAVALNATMRRRAAVVPPAITTRQIRHRAVNAFRRGTTTNNNNNKINPKTTTMAKGGVIIHQVGGPILERMSVSGGARLQCSLLTHTSYPPLP